jgi:hypothetical protein
MKQPFKHYFSVHVALHSLDLKMLQFRVVEFMGFILYVQLLYTPGSFLKLDAFRSARFVCKATVTVYRTLFMQIEPKRNARPF